MVVALVVHLITPQQRETATPLATVIHQVTQAVALVIHLATVVRLITPQQREATIPLVTQMEQQVVVVRDHPAHCVAPHNTQKNIRNFPCPQDATF